MPDDASQLHGADAIIYTDNLEKLFPIKKGVFGRTVGHVHAVDGVTLSIQKGETLGLVGESGCGKTTFGRAVLRLVEPSGGRIVFDGKDILGVPPTELRSLRKQMQIVFQDPYSSLDPRMTVERIVGEGFAIHGPPESIAKNVKFAQRERIHQLIEQVGLSDDHMTRLPHEFSGGQKQRIALARALALEPDFVVLDEPTSALDVSVQAQALNLLKRLQGKFGLTYLFISHDLSVVAHMSDRIAVMYLGKIIELAPAMEFLNNAKHPYTQALIASIPIPDPRLRKERKGIEGEVPSPIDPPNGCRFHPRCSVAFGECGWEARDLVPYLTDQERILDSNHPMSKHILVKRKKQKVSGDEVARLFLEALKSQPDYSQAGSPLYGIVHSVERDGASIVVGVVKGKENDVVAAVDKLVRLLRDTSHPDLVGPSSSSKLGADKIALTFHEAKILTDVRKLRSDEFAAFIDLKADADPETVKRWLQSRVSELKETVPMFKAVAAVERVAGDRRVMVRCRRGRMPAEEVARRFLDILEPQMRGAQTSHRLSGEILGASLEGSKVTVEIAPGKADLVIVSIKNLIKRLRKTTNPELKSLKRISKPSDDRIELNFRRKTMSAKRTAKMLGRMIEDELDVDSSSRQFNTMASVMPTREGVMLGVLGPDDSWEKTVLALKEFVASAKDRKNWVAESVTGVEVRTVKGPKDSIVVKLRRVAEPDLVDIGDGHLVACRLCGPATCDIRTQ